MHLILCYSKEGSVNYDEPIGDIQVLVATRKKKLMSPEYHLVIPKGYKIVNFSLGKQEKNRIITYLKKKNKLKLK